MTTYEPGTVAWVIHHYHFPSWREPIDGVCECEPTIARLMSIWRGEPRELRWHVFGSEMWCDEPNDDTHSSVEVLRIIDVGTPNGERSAA